MNKYLDFIKQIDKAQNIMLVCHMSPDGDAFGSTTALYKALINLNKNVELYCQLPYSKKLNFIPNAKQFLKEKTITKYDLAISLDCADSARLGEYERLFFNAKKTICIDHHGTNPKYADYNYISPSSAATCEYLYDMLKELDSLNKCIDKDVAFSLYCGIITDSGYFKNTSSTEKTMDVAVALAKEYKIDSKKIVYHFMDEIELNVFKLKVRVLSKVRFNEEKTVGLIYFSQQDFKETNTDITCTEGIINEVKNIAGIRVAAAITQVGEEKFKVSLRSHENYPIANLAAQKGGGGHNNAAGYQEYGYEIDVLDQVMSDCSKYAE